MELSSDDLPRKAGNKASVSTSHTASSRDLSPDYLSVFAFHRFDVEAPYPFMSTILLVSDPPSPGTIFQTAPGRTVEQAVPQEEEEGLWLVKWRFH